MNDKAQTILNNKQFQINVMNDQRRSWLYASSLVFAGIILLIFGWNWLDEFHSKSIWWVVVSLMLLLSINWWYWTMRLVRKLLETKQEEHELLHFIIHNIREIKDDVRQLGSQSIDKSK